MLFRKSWYYIKEAFRSLARNGVMVLASIASIIATLLVSGIILIGLTNISSLIGELGTQVEVTVFMNEDADTQYLQLVEKEMKEWAEVSEISFISKTEALEKMKEKMGDNRQLLEGYKGQDNPLPCSFVIKAKTPQDVKPIISRLTGMARVEKINYSQKVVDSLTSIILGMRTVGWGAVALLFGVSFVIIANTIRLALITKRRQIHIMKYIGATDWFIRWPFVIEGFVIGITGALLAFGIVAAAYYVLVGRGLVILDLFRLVPTQEVIPPLILPFSALGGGVGILATLFSMRKYLRV